MAIQEITSPPILDETGQDIVTKLGLIADNVNSNAGQIDYSNTTSQLQATRVQTAIDEVKGITDTISASLTNLIRFINTDTNTTTVASGANATIDHSYSVPTGYTAVAVTGFQLSGTGAGSVSVYNMWIISAGARLQVHNHGTGSVNISSLCRIMCVKSEFV